MRVLTAPSAGSQVSAVHGLWSSTVVTLVEGAGKQVPAPG